MRRNYFSYLLRIWRTDSSGVPTWVATLENPHTHQVFHFGSLKAMWHFLKRQRGAEHNPPTGAQKKSEVS